MIIFFLIIPVIFTTLAVSGIMLTASKLLLVILIFQKLFFLKMPLYVAFPFHAFREERKNFSFIYNGRSILFVDYDNFLTDIFSNIIEENINEIEESQDFIYFMLKSILKHDLENLNSISQNLSVLRT
ncbi:MAG: hypothetical protein ACLRR3_04165 [Eubacterium sp.]